MTAIAEKPELKPELKHDSNPVSKDDLKTLPMPELQKKLGSTPDGLSQAEAEKRLTQYGPNEITEKKTNQLLKFLSYFWGPIPWMIEGAVILVGAGAALAGFLHHSSSALFQRSGRILGRTPGRQRHRRSESPAGDPGQSQARRQVAESQSK